MRHAPLLAVLLAACGGGKTTTPSGPANLTGSGAADTGAGTGSTFGAGPPMVTVGEHMQYRLKLRGLELAIFEIGVGDVMALAGKQVVVVQSHSQSTGIADMVSSVDDHFSSWIDVATGRSLRFQADELSTQNKQDIEHSITDFAGRTGNAVPVTFGVNDQPPAKDTQLVSAADVWDFNSFLIALRSWDPKAGTKLSSEAMRSRWMWRLETTVVGTEKLVTELGELPALKFETHCSKLGRDGQRAPNNSDRDFTIYISDDADRVPLLVTAATDYGDVKLEIVDYQPGTGPKLRPE